METFKAGFMETWKNSGMLQIKTFMQYESCIKLIQS